MEKRYKSKIGYSMGVTKEWVCDCWGNKRGLKKYYVSLAPVVAFVALYGSFAKNVFGLELYDRENKEYVYPAKSIWDYRSK